MASFQDVLDNIARVVGGTAPSASTPRWFSGNQTGDGTGITSPLIHGCYSTQPPGALADPPVGLLQLANFTVPDPLHQGAEDNADFVRLIIVVPSNDPETQVATLMGFRDAVPTQFRSHMQAFAAANVLDVFPLSGRYGVYDHGGELFPSIEFLLRVRRYLPVTYSP